ncbi:type IV pilus assembly protein PilQ [Desulfomicrobium macestii]|uniref:Type IV pilus assembly protein PilQ n=2 Tax=Desulfomicrobium TaxID=898 RepID=A0A8G2BZ84_DESNO|nr:MULTISPECIES: type IV pilus secretin PilQ [Desulfomicrobium]MBE1423621.1 type IV pilus assembly protein PilQ [Desulfomicrobium macestii]SFL22507.1 type IV pilus assembly protein PilQ [Desulfomicrobium norvegicum]
MKIFRAISGFLFFGCIVVLTSCATHSKPANMDTGAGTDVPVQNLPAVVVSEALGKTIIDMPLDANTQVYADHDADKNIKVLFTPPVTDFELPLNVTELVSDIQKEMDGDKVTALNVFLKANSKFLLSKQSETLGRLMLVSDETSTPQLPSNYISSLNFKPKNDSLQVVTYSSLPFEVTPGQDGDFKLTFRKVQFQDALLKKYDVTKLGSAIDYVTALNGNDGNAYLVFAGAKNPALSVLRKGDETHILIKGKSAQAGMGDVAGTEAAAPGDALAETTSEIQELNTLFPGMKERYTGERISIDLQDADVEHVLRLISEISGYNLILDDDISGKISLKLVDIPWDQALDLVLLQRGLGMVIKGNIMRIASTTKLEAERVQLQKAREAAIQAQVSMQNLAPLKTEYMQINYNTAAEFEGKVKTMLTGRGSASSDPRTNILIVTDTEDTLKRVDSFIKKLDRAERQVMIEARLVYATDEFQRSLGVKWGTTYSTETAENLPSEQWRGNFASTGLNAINTVNGITLGGTIGKFLGEDLFALDAALQLGEAKNLVKTISSPRILTLNNNRAEIQQGTKLATATESESGGTTTEYEEAVLKISVLPQITPDNKLILDLEISDDSPKSDGRDIDTKQTKTKMMVSDRETIVIGGVQKTTETSGTNQIPGLGDVPGLGWLFKNTYDAKSKAELLIFIQPRIM